MRIARLAVCVLAVIGAAGCLTFKTVVEIKPDGSGRIVESQLMGKAVLDMFKQMSEGMSEAGGKGEKKAFDPFPEKDVRDKAAKMGAGVTFVESRKIKSGDSEGRESIYAFKDVSGLTIDAKPSSPGPQEPQQTSDTPKFSFKKLPNGHAQLSIVIPESKDKGKDKSKDKDKEKGKSAAKAEKGKPAKAPTAEELQQMKQVLKGLKMSLVVDVKGKIVHTNCPYVEGNRVTIFEMDFEQLLTNEAKLKELASLDDKNSLDAVRKVLTGIPGIKVALEPEITIEFQ